MSFSNDYSAALRRGYSGEGERQGKYLVRGFIEAESFSSSLNRRAPREPLLNTGFNSTNSREPKHVFKQGNEGEVLLNHKIQKTTLELRERVNLIRDP